MKATLVRSLAVGAGVAAVSVLAATSAYAHAAPFTVKAGSAPNGTAVAVTGTTGAISFKDTTSNQNLTCTSATLKGSITTTTSANGVKIASINGAGAAFNGCTGPAGLKFAVTGVGTWYINVSDSTNGVAKGQVFNIIANVKSTNPAVPCTFSVGANKGTFAGTVPPGTVDGSYSNSTKGLTIAPSNPGSLGLWNVKGSGTNTYCVSSSILKQGDKASFGATFTLKADNAAYDPIAIS